MWAPPRGLFGPVAPGGRAGAPALYPARGPGGGGRTGASARCVLGGHWRGASEMEREEHLALLRERIFRICESRLSQFSGEAVKVLGVTPRSSDVTVVKTELTLMPFPPIQVDWHVATTSDIHKVIDVFVQGVSETMTNRDSFGATIQSLGKGLEGLLVVLRENVAAQTSC